MSGATGNLKEINDFITGLSLNQTQGFDPAKFVNDALAGAQQQFEDTVLPELAALQNVIGGTTRSNSAAALLSSRAESQNAARLAGVRTQATAEAQDISRQNLAATAALAGTNVDQLTQVAEILRGAISTGETEAAGEQVSSKQDTEQTTGETTQTSQQDVKSQQTEVQQLLDIVVSLLEQQATSKVTEEFKGINTGKTRGSVLDIVDSIGNFVSNVSGP